MNWGKGIILIYIFFVAGIGYLVYGATQTNFELVEENYYEKELAFQNQINWTKNAIDQKMKLHIEEVAAGVVISVQSQDSTVNNAFTSATAWFYNPMEKSKDRHLDLGASQNGQWVIQKEIPKGNYEVKLRWSNAHKDTFFAVSEFSKK